MVLGSDNVKLGDRDLPFSTIVDSGVRAEGHGWPSLLLDEEWRFEDVAVNVGVHQ
jgi:hypothetical protein